MQKFIDKHNITITVATAVSVLLFIIWWSFVFGQVFNSMSYRVTHVEQECAEWKEMVDTIDKRIDEIEDEHDEQIAQIDVQLAEIAKDLQYIKIALKIDQ